MEGTDQVKDPAVSKFKVLLLGEAGVGKTSTFLRVRDGEYRENGASTVGIDNCSKYVGVNNKKVQVALWDTAGAERFRTLTRNYYRNTQAVLLMFSVNEPSTLFYLSKWEEDVKEYAPTAMRFLVGNKTDQERLVTKETMESFAIGHNCECLFLISAKTGNGVEEALATITERLLSFYQMAKYQKDNSWLENSIHVNQGNEIGVSREKSCC